jgi:ERCC4-type nuclease
MEFFLDNREHHLAKLLPNLTLKQLDIGDFQVCFDGEPRLVYERKTLPDLEASIKDGRYREQKARALAGDFKFYYILETSNGLDYSNSKSVTGAIINTITRDNIPIVFTSGPEQTSIFIQCLIDKVFANPETYINKNSMQSVSYLECIAPKKKNNIDTLTCFILQLASIPGISTGKAQSIVDGHGVKNMAELCKLMSGHSPEEFFKHTTGIGQILAKSIYKHLGI